LEQIAKAVMLRKFTSVCSSKHQVPNVRSVYIPKG
jgi:hypothetical protein